MKIDNANKTLKECPFCGGHTEIKIKHSSPEVAWAECAICNATSASFEANIYSSAIDDAVRAWNRRNYNETDMS